MLNHHTIRKLILSCYWLVLGLGILPSIELYGARHSGRILSYAPLKRLEADVNRSVVQGLPALQKAFGTPKGFGYLKNTTITLDYKHIFGMDFDIKNNRTVTLNGFHHDTKNQVEKSGIIQFSIKAKNKYGCYRAALLYQGKHLGTKNFFPAMWPRIKVVNKIREAYNNALKHGSKIYKRLDGSFEIYGTTQEGITIKMIVNKRGVMITAYPEKI